MSRLGTIRDVLPEAFSDVDVQYPLPTDSDSVYAKDVWSDQSVVTGWSDASSTGLPIAWIPFTNLHTVIEYTGTDNPKVLTIHFQRTVSASQVSLGAYAGDFSNVKLEVLGSGGEVRDTIDLSGDSTKYTSLRIPFEPQLFNAIRLSFLTADTVSLSNITIQKTVVTASQIQGIKPDGTLTTINATQGGNLKVSLEELENTISVNSNSQLRTTRFDSSGNEFNLDLAQNAAVSIGALHHEIHEGDTYKVHNVNTAVASGGDITIVLTTGAKSCHTTFYGSSGGDALLYLFEGSTVTVAGTAMVEYNKNRNSSNTATAAAELNPTASGGAILDQLFIPGGSGPTAPGGATNVRDEWVLKPSTIYRFKLVNSTATTQTLNLAIEWYEV